MKNNTKTTINQFKKILLLTIILGCVFSACKEVKSTKEKIQTTISQKKKVLRHMVIFKFKEDASQDNINRINKNFNDLPNHISVIKNFEWGLNDSPEDFDQDFTHCYLLTFESEKDRDSIYTPHPKHQAFVAGLKPYLEKVFVVDYWTKP